MAADPTYNPEASAFDKMEKKKKINYLTNGSFIYLCQGGLCCPSCLFVSWLVCQQDYRKTTERISTKLEGGWVLAQNTEETDPGIFFSRL